MGPVLKEIKETYDNYKSRRFRYREPLKTCHKAPFSPMNFWMYHYLFPEVLLVADCGLSYPCSYLEEDEIMRIMAEHGLL